MTFDSALFDPTQLYLEIDAATQAQAWQQSQAFATEASRWEAYLNQLCLDTVLPWLQEDYQPRTTVFPSRNALFSIWEGVSGTLLTLDTARFLILPVETLDLDEVRVPQEWVDIPNWVADYYLAVQVNEAEGWLRVSGFTTHQQLKAQGRYDWRDRTYAISEEALIPDLNALWVTRQLNPTLQTRVAVSELPSLSVAQAEHLIERLGHPEVLRPRLEVPFEQWGKLMEHGGWRQQLAMRRRGLPHQKSVLRWLQDGVSALAQQVGWEQVELQPSAVGARGDEATEPIAVLCRRLAIAGQQYELRVFPVGVLENRIWRFELRNLAVGGRIPGGFKLTLLTEDLQPFAGNEDVATEAVDELYIEVAVEAGEGLVWEVEPIPSEYDREILTF